MKTTVTQSSTSSWHVVTATHPGARAVQEDAVQSWQASAAALLAVVADGAGGHGGGDKASRTVLEKAAQLWHKLATETEGAHGLAEWIVDAHAAVNVQTGGQREGARCAALALLAHGTRADWVHVGDCRLYHFRAGERLFRTRDDSVVQVLCDQGEITEAEMGHHVDQNRLLQCLGGPEVPRPRQGGAELLPGDVFILCSDGFWENLMPEEIAQLAASPPAGWRRTLPAALGKAVSQGGPRADNATALIAAFQPAEGPRAPIAGRLLAALLAILLLLFCLAALQGRLVDLPTVLHLRHLMGLPSAKPSHPLPFTQPAP